MKEENKPFMVRLRPTTRQLLEVASKDQRRSMASLIDEAVKTHLQPRYGHLDTRIERFLMGAKQ